MDRARVKREALVWSALTRGPVSETRFWDAGVVAFEEGVYGGHPTS